MTYLYGILYDKPANLVNARVEYRPIAGLQRLDRRRRRQHAIDIEQLGPALRPHHRAAPTAECTGADDPRLAGPAPRQQSPRRRIMDDAAIAGEEPALRNGDDLAKGRHPVLQRHSCPPPIQSV